MCGDLFLVVYQLYLGNELVVYTCRCLKENLKLKFLSGTHPPQNGNFIHIIMGNKTANIKMHQKVKAHAWFALSFVFAH